MNVAVGEGGVSGGSLYGKGASVGAIRSLVGEVLGRLTLAPFPLVLGECPGVFFRRNHRGLFTLAFVLFLVRVWWLWYQWEPEVCAFRVGALGARCRLTPYPFEAALSYGVWLFTALAQYMFFTAGVTRGAKVAMLSLYAVASLFSSVFAREGCRMLLFGIGCAFGFSPSLLWKLMPLAFMPWWCSAIYPAFLWRTWVELFYQPKVFVPIVKRHLPTTLATTRHPLLEVPLVAGVSAHAKYFADRPAEGGMRDEERRMAQVGDRVLKLLLAHCSFKRGLSVADVSAAELNQTDEALSRWVLAQRLGGNVGQKTRASFVEVMWAELWFAHVEGLLEFDQLVVAFLAFDKQVGSMRCVLI